MISPILLAVGLFDFLCRRPRSIERTLWEHTISSTPLLSDLSVEERGRLKEFSETLLSTKQVIVSDGPAAEPGELVVVAATCSLPILELGTRWYRGWSTIVLFPDVYRRTWTEEDEFGVVSEYEGDVEGEVLEYGSIIIARRRIRARSSSVIIHEMAHQLDRLSGEINGIPPLPPEMNSKTWVDTLDTRLEELRRQLDHGRRTALDAYAGESREELFAVASERFFTEPAVLRRLMPDVYELLSAFYRQDPAARRRKRNNTR